MAKRITTEAEAVVDVVECITNQHGYEPAGAAGRFVKTGNSWRDWAGYRNSGLTYDRWLAAERERMDAVHESTVRARRERGTQ